MRRRRWWATTVLLALGLAGCGMPMPADPDGTLDRITGSVLRVGASPSGTLVEVDEDGVSGSLVELLEGFAQNRDARIEWHVDSEERLVDDLTSGGQVFHVEAFVVPVGREVSLDDLDQARQSIVDLDWKMQDVVVIPVRTLPDESPP